MNNIERIRGKLPEYKLDAMLVTDRACRLFATGFSASAGALLVTERGAWFFTDSRYFEAASAAVKDAEVHLTTPEVSYYDHVIKIIGDRNACTIGFEDNTTTFAGLQSWKKKLKGKASFVPAQKLIDALRDVKSRDDLKMLIKAQRLAEKVWDEILPLINTDMTEKDLAAEIIYRALKNGADNVSFPPIVVSGKNSSRPHGVPGSKKIGKGFLTIDFGVLLNGWCSDTTRTLCIGKPDAEMVRVYDTVLSAQEAGIKKIHGGVKAVAVDKAARTVIEKAGYGEYFGHGFGHSLGFEVHESLKASQISKDILPVGAVMSAEPGIYLPGRYGVRIEDVVYVTEDGCENITKLPKSLLVL